MAAHDSTPKTLQSADWLAARCGVPRLRAYEMIRAIPQELGVVRIGRTVKVRPEKVEAWIEAGGSSLADVSEQ